MKRVAEAARVVLGRRQSPVRMHASRRKAKPPPTLTTDITEPNRTEPKENGSTHCSLAAV